MHSVLPANGAPVSRQRTSRVKEMYTDYVREQTLQNWKFWIVSAMRIFHYREERNFNVHFLLLAWSHIRTSSKFVQFNRFGGQYGRALSFSYDLGRPTLLFG